MRKRTKSRELALQILYQINITGDNADNSLNNFWKKHRASPQIKEFAVELVTGTITNLRKIDQTISKCTENWQIERIAVVERNILRMACYELLFMEDIPPKVSINEAINIAKKFATPQSGKFVNGILDKIKQTKVVKKSRLR